MSKRRKKSAARKSDGPPNFQVARGIFSVSELENLLWETAWIDWTKSKSDTYSMVTFGGSAAPESRAIVSALDKLVDFLPGGKNLVSIWFERHKEGEHCKLLPPEADGTVVMLSLAQFRGGRTFVGDFKGYINPGEVLIAKVSPKSAAYQVEKVSSGERIVLCLAQMLD